MQEDKRPTDTAENAQNSPKEALKKAPGPAKGGWEKREARLAAALRENLRRRKTARADKTDCKETD